MRREHKTAAPIPSNWVLLNTFTSSNSSWSPSRAYSEYGLFIVGGGAGGRSDFNNQGNGGNGGNGGVVNSFTIQLTGIPTFNIVVGAGGAKSNTGTNGTGNAGSASSITVNGTTYSAAGGLAPANGYNSNYTTGRNTKVQNSGLGGTHAWSLPYLYKASATTPEGQMGEDGLPNPFDPNDTNLYGAGGGAGFNSYTYGSNTSMTSQIPNGILGGDTGGGNGGYGTNNGALNDGSDGSFYGAGGGGAAFSSSHGHRGGAGHAGIVMIYGKL